MKNLETIFAIFTLTCSLLSCSKSDDPKSQAPSKEYPASIIYQWDGSVTATDFGTTYPQKTLRLKVKANGILEVFTDEGVAQTTPIISEWYTQGDIFYCSYTSSNGKKYTYKLLRNKDLNMVGFRGINGETSGAGRIYIFVV